MCRAEKFGIFFWLLGIAAGARKTKQRKEKNEKRKKLSVKKKKENK
jgi:hypothetical protein